MAYTFNVLISLPVDTDEEAKESAVIVLRVLGLLNRERPDTFDKLGLVMMRADGSEVDLPYPEFPKGREP